MGGTELYLGCFSFLRFLKCLLIWDCPVLSQKMAYEDQVFSKAVSSPLFLLSLFLLRLLYLLYFFWYPKLPARDFTCDQTPSISSLDVSSMLPVTVILSWMMSLFYGAMQWQDWMSNSSRTQKHSTARSLLQRVRVSSDSGCEAAICMLLFVLAGIFKQSGKVCACSAAAQCLMSNTQFQMGWGRVHSLAGVYRLSVSPMSALF